MDTQSHGHGLASGCCPPPILPAPFSSGFLLSLGLAEVSARLHPALGTDACPPSQAPAQRGWEGGKGAELWSPTYLDPTCCLDVSGLGQGKGRDLSCLSRPAEANKHICIWSVRERRDALREKGFFSPRCIVPFPHPLPSSLPACLRVPISGHLCPKTKAGKNDHRRAP